MTRTWGTALRASAGRRSAEAAAAGEKFVIEPFTDNCRVVCRNRAHAVMGVSPNNSYFNVSQLTELLGWVCGAFRRVDVVVPDSAVVHTYRALGHEPEQAKKKARRETAVLRNRVLRAWEAAGGMGEGHRVHLMSALAGHPVYRRLRVQVRTALATDARLRETCLAMSREVVGARMGGAVPTQAQQETGIGYLVAELPFFLDSAAIFDAPSSLCFYHRPVPLADLIFSWETSLRPSPRQGYALVYPAPHGAAASAVPEGER
ncbi:tRNA-dependent cyclodipeptide synthase [Actinomadura algeriensis]|uniref:Cyclodipeptide synthase n=1 Tax=Actinomadura algeriensis TaxID=1679523 RepID=A0ABR9K486_9ACTN|nr:tRNA-dependent cyclodipeptide synthase [Actinomadura algeriensis]MBE1537651.1 cyclo(L-tyrosyl-L-tyrosyl) synthase [Actinomadura algeriensis]